MLPSNSNKSIRANALENLCCHTRRNMHGVPATCPICTWNPHPKLADWSRELPTWIHLCIFVYRMGRLCGGAREISGIKAPIFLHWWMLGSGVGSEVGVVQWVGEWWCGGGQVVGGEVGGGVVGQVVGGGWGD